MGARHVYDLPDLPLPNQVAFARLFFIIDDTGEVKVQNLHFHFECHG
jgi:hypothetical protein